MAGQSEPRALSRAGTLVVRGRVVLLDADGHERPASAGTRVFSFAGERAERIAETATDSAGAFELREDLASADAGGRGARDRGFVAESRDPPACSYPVFVSIDGSRGADAAPPLVRLALRPGVLVRGRLVDPAGKPVAHGQCFARWTLPPGAHVSEGDEGAASPRHEIIDSDEEGKFEIVVPAGLLQLRGRRGRLGGLGPSADLEAGADSQASSVQVVVGAEDADVRIRVVSTDGSPVPSSLAMLRSADVLYAVTSPALDRRDVGAVFGDASGTITIGGVSRDAAPFVVGVGAPGFVPRRFVISPARQGSSPESVTLAPKLLVFGTLRAPDGTEVHDLDATWDVQPGASEETGAPRSMARSDDVLELVDEQVPKAECERDDAIGGWRFRVPVPGRYDITARVEGLPPAHVAVEVERSDSRFSLTLPAGRRLVLRAAFPEDPEDATRGGYSWRLSVFGTTLKDANSPSRPLLHVPHWEPTVDSPELVLWCPTEASLLRVGPSTHVDLPVGALELPVPPVGAAPLPVRLSGIGSGTLELRYESPAGTPRSGVELELLPASTANDDIPRGIRWVRTGEHGSATVAVPAGEYFVGRSRSYGDPQWARVRVAAGVPTPVTISR